MWDALRSGHIETAEYVDAEFGDVIDWWFADFSHHAAMSGNLAMLQWCYFNHGCAMDKRTLACAAESGNLEMVQWLREPAMDMLAFRREIYKWNETKEACENLSKVLESGIEHDKKIYADWGQVYVFDWPEVPENVVRKYAPNVSILLARHLAKSIPIKPRCKWDHMTTRYAAVREHYHIVRWAVENGCEINERTRAIMNAERPLPKELNWGCLTDA